MTRFRVVLLLFALLGWSSNAFAACSFFDVKCYLGHTIEKSTNDVGKALEKGVHDAGEIIDKGAPLTPVREYLRAKDIPPPEAGAYGIVVFQSKPTAANKTKLIMVCNSFIAFFPRSETSKFSNVRPHDHNLAARRSRRASS
jgi:hypothetical protein